MYLIMAMSNLHRKIAFEVYHLFIECLKQLNRAKYKNRVVGVCVTDRLNRKKYLEKSSFVHRVARSYIELLHCLQTTFSIVSQICLFMIRVLITPAIIVGSQITRIALAMPCINHDRPSKFDRSNGALYTARHEDSSRNGFFKASHFRVSLLLFFSRYSSIADLLVLPQL